MTVSKEAVEAAARALNPGLAWDNGKSPGEWKRRAVNDAEIALTAALPFLAPPAPSQSDDAAAKALIRAIEDASDSDDEFRIVCAALAEATLAGAAAERDFALKFVAAKDREIAAVYAKGIADALREAKSRHPGFKQLHKAIAALSAPPAPVSRPEYPGNIGPFASPAPDPAPNDATRLARAFNAWTPPAPDPAKSVGSVTHIPSSPLIVDDTPDPAEATLANADQIEFEAGILLEQRAKAAEAMRDGAIYAAVSRAKDPEGYDKMLDEVTADARAVLAAEAMRAKCEAIIRDNIILDCGAGDKQLRKRPHGEVSSLAYADAIAALKGQP